MMTNSEYNKMCDREHRDLARSALGLRSGSKSYQNHFYCGSGSTEYDRWMDMVALGRATRHNTSTKDFFLFVVTFDYAKEVLLPGEELDVGDFPSYISRP